MRIGAAALALTFVGAAAFPMATGWAQGRQQPSGPMAEEGYGKGQPGAGQMGSESQQGYGRHHGAGHRMSAGDLRQAQQKLQDAGYDPGPIDGRMGPKTHHAVKQFQQAKSLPSTGRLDHQTLSTLDVHPGQGGGATSGARRSGTMDQGTRHGMDRGDQPGSAPGDTGDTPH